MFDKYTLLIESAKKNNTENVKFLVEQGADVNLILSLRFGSTTTEMYTALRFAVWNDNVELAEYLLKHGAKPNINYTSSGCYHYFTFTLYDCAKSQEMSNLLNSYMKTNENKIT